MNKDATLKRNKVHIDVELPCNPLNPDEGGMGFDLVDGAPTTRDPESVVHAKTGIPAGGFKRHISLSIPASDHHFSTEQGEAITQALEVLALYMRLCHLKKPPIC